MTDELGTPDFRPQNALELELVRAAHEPAHRPAFFREFLDATVYLALLLSGGSRIEAGADGRAVVPEGAGSRLGRPNGTATARCRSSAPRSERRPSTGRTM